MWEQFSYYGMRALLVYYMTKELLFAQEHSSFVYGAYTACAYFTPIIGGVIADRYLGKRRAIIIGASVMALGHFMMAFEPLFYAALATIALGNGLFLPSLPSQIDDLYERDDPKRSWAFNVYYVGINIGGFLAPLICGTLGEVYGWHYGFGAAGIGMVAGLGIYLWGQRYLPDQRVSMVALGSGDKTAREPFSPPVIFLLIGIALAVTVFRGAYEQVGNTLALWADSGVDRAMGTFVIPMTWFQSLNPLMVMLMTPALLAWWSRKSASSTRSALAYRMATGSLIVGLAYALLGGVELMTGAAPASWVWLAVFFVIFTFGELFILPTGLGIFARMAPRGQGATTVACWYFVIFLGSLCAGMVGTLWSSMSHAAFFFLLSGMGLAAAIFLVLLQKPLDRVDG